MMEWETELDSYTGTYRGVDWWIKRTKGTGALCGYIASPYGEDITMMDFNTEVHGGITYYGSGWDDLPERVMGFDCSHFGDYCPEQKNVGTIGVVEVYRNVSYVTEQLHLLIDELLLERSLTIVPYPRWDSDEWSRSIGINSSLPATAQRCLTGWGFTDPEEAMVFALTL